MTYFNSDVSARPAMQQLFNEYRHIAVDVGIEQAFGSHITLVPPSVAELRIIDSTVMRVIFLLAFSPTTKKKPGL
jgi:hypothetical protein